VHQLWYKRVGGNSMKRVRGGSSRSVRWTLQVGKLLRFSRVEDHRFEDLRVTRVEHIVHVEDDRPKFSIAARIAALLLGFFGPGPPDSGIST